MCLAAALLFTIRTISSPERLASAAIRRAPITTSLGVHGIRSSSIMSRLASTPPILRALTISTIPGWAAPCSEPLHLISRTLFARSKTWITSRRLAHRFRRRADGGSSPRESACGLRGDARRLLSERVFAPVSNGCPATPAPESAQRCSAIRLPKIPVEQSGREPSARFESRLLLLLRTVFYTGRPVEPEPIPEV